MNSGTKGMPSRGYVDVPVGVYTTASVVRTIPIGVQPVDVELYAENIIADSGWVLGDRVLIVTGNCGFGSVVSEMTVALSNGSLVIAQSSVAICIHNRSTGASVGLTSGSWKLVARIYT